MWAWTRRRSSPASQRELDVGASSSGVASASAMRVGPWLAPLRNSRSPLTDRSSCAAAPGAARCGGGARRTCRRPPSASSSTRDVSCSVGSPRALRPPQRRLVDRDRPLDLVLARGERLVEPRGRASPSVVRSTTVRAPALSSVARSTTTARSAVASRHSTRRRRMRTGPVSVMRTGRQMPPGFQSGSRQSQCWNTPVRLRLAVRSLGRRAGDLDGEQVLAARPERVGDLEGVREEVALGVAEVGAVEPDVALVEEPVEHRATARRPSAGPIASNGAGTAAARRCRRTPASSASGRAPRRLPAAVVEAVVRQVAAQVLVGDARRATSRSSSMERSLAVAGRGRRWSSPGPRSPSSRRPAAGVNVSSNGAGRRRRGAVAALGAARRR